MANALAKNVKLSVVFFFSRVPFPSIEFWCSKCQLFIRLWQSSSQVYKVSLLHSDANSLLCWYCTAYSISRSFRPQINAEWLYSPTKWSTARWRVTWYVLSGQQTTSTVSCSAPSRGHVRRSTWDRTWGESIYASWASPIIPNIPKTWGTERASPTATQRPWVGGWRTRGKCLFDVTTVGQSSSPWPLACTASELNTVQFGCSAGCMSM